MNNIVVKNNQSLIDISLQSAGSIDAIFDIAKKNNISSLTSTLEVSSLSSSEIINESITEYLQGINTPATAGNYVNNNWENKSIESIILLQEKDSVTVKNNQSLIDIALQTTGKIESVFDIAKSNGIPSIVSDVKDLKIIKSIVIDTKIVKELEGINTPATAGIYTGSLNGEYEVEEYSNEEYNI